jgi:hypothetical protein
MKKVGYFFLKTLIKVNIKLGSLSRLSPLKHGKVDQKVHLSKSKILNMTVFQYKHKKVGLIFFKNLIMEDSMH